MAQTSSMPSVRKFISALSETWRLDEQETSSFKKVCFSEENGIKLRLKLLLSIRAKLAGLFQDLENENQWLREKREMLSGATPFKFIMSGKLEELQRVEALVRYMCGR